MHYKNGREAKNGDKVVLFSPNASPVVGVLFDASPGKDRCNGKIAPIPAITLTPDLSQCLHLDDVLKALPAQVPNTAT